MDVMIHQQAEREAVLLQAHREELVERIAQAMRQDGTAQPLQGLHLYRRSSPLELLHGAGSSFPMRKTRTALKEEGHD